MVTSPGTGIDKHAAKFLGLQAHKRLCTNYPRTVAAPVHVNAPWAASICELKFASVQDGNTPPDRIACPRSTALVLANGEYEYSTEQGPGSRKGRRLPPIFGTPAQEPYRNGRLLGPWTKLVLYIIYKT